MDERTEQAINDARDIVVEQFGYYTNDPDLMTSIPTDRLGSEAAAIVIATQLARIAAALEQIKSASEVDAIATDVTP